jgi:hypothetical protein
MAKGFAITVGLNAVDPQHYAGWSGQLVACESDALALAGIARNAGFAVTTLLTRQATSAALLGELARAAKELVSGDILYVALSCHGGQIKDANGDEADGLDETVCLWDRQVSDDELDQAWSQFAKGVRIFVTSDSCHSGTVVRAIYSGRFADVPFVPAPHGKAMPRDVQNQVYSEHRALYDGLARDIPANVLDSVQASVLLISGCQDNQLSADGPFNGLFTSTLLRVWNHASFDGSYRLFRQRIVDLMPSDQTPNFYRIGAPNRDFENQRPFTI